MGKGTCPAGPEDAAILPLTAGDAVLPKSGRLADTWPAIVKKTLKRHQAAAAIVTAAFCGLLTAAITEPAHLSACLSSQPKAAPA